VSVDARAVAVANRHTGLTKIWAREEFCDPNKNGQPGVQTSTGPNDVLAFDQDDCIAWHNPFSENSYSVQRPVAWTSGVLNEETCEYEEQKVWTTTGAQGSFGQCGPDGIYVHLVDGEDGSVEDFVHIPENVQTCGSLGPYGAAVDSENDVWFYVWGGGAVFVEVDYDTLDYTIHSGSSYGITVDTKDRVWNGSSIPRRYDPVNKVTDTTQGGSIMGNYGTGIAQDHEGRMWVGASGGFGWVDMETMQVGPTIAIPGATGLFRGISVDVDGYIWGVPLGGTEAWRYDPDTEEAESVGGLNGPYTYSDMTGGQLNQVTCGTPEG
jgi:hypothetical protein